MMYNICAKLRASDVIFSEIFKFSLRCAQFADFPHRSISTLGESESVVKIIFHAFISFLPMVNWWIFCNIGLFLTYFFSDFLL